MSNWCAPVTTCAHRLTKGRISSVQDQQTNGMPVCGIHARFWARRGCKLVELEVE